VILAFVKVLGIVLVIVRLKASVLAVIKNVSITRARPISVQHALVS
jgi:hypothetical protein